MGKSKPTVVNADVQPCIDNPQSWLPLLGGPPGETGPVDMRVLFGTLRPSYRGFAPSLTAYALAKVTVAPPLKTPEWTITAHRGEVLLPPHAADNLLCPRTLFETFEREAASSEALGTCITMRWAPQRLHEQWEIGRALCRSLIHQYQVAALLVQHLPGRNLSASTPHLHIVIPGPRRFMPWGTLGDIVKPLCRDTGRQLIIDRIAALVG